VTADGRGPISGFAGGRRVRLSIERESEREFGLALADFGLDDGDGCPKIESALEPSGGGARVTNPFG
jgi:hypothetical protein